jgi:MFS family permease
MGDQLFNVVLGWIAAASFGTNAGLLQAGHAAVLLATALLSGRIADRLGLRATLIGADLARAAALGLMILLWLTLGDPPAGSLIFAVVVLGIGMGFFRPALQAMLPILSPREILPATNALMDTTERLARLIGPGLVSLAAASIPLVHFVTIDLLTFLASALAVALIVLPRGEIALPPPQRSLFASLSQGFRVVRRHPLLWFVLLLTGVINGAWYMAYYIGLPLMLLDGERSGGVGNGVAAFGAIISAYGVTNLATNLVVGNRPVSTRPHLMIFGGNLFLGVGTVLLGLAGLVLPSHLLIAGFVGAALLSAIGGPMQDITVATLRQTELPKAEIAAATRAFMVVNQAGLLVALLASPLILGAVGAGWTVAGCGVAVLGVCFAGLWRFRRI